MKTLGILIVVLFLSNISYGQDVFSKIDSIVKLNHLKNPNISISVGFINNDAEFYTSYGHLSRVSDVKVDKNSVFEIASITKILTANLIAQAEIEGKLNINDFMDDYLPKQYQLHENLQYKIRISDLASHQSGLPDIDFRQLIASNSQQPVSSVTEASLAQLINNAKELIDYGNYRYSTIGYILLGQILEDIYDKSYASIFEEKMIQPLKLTGTFTNNFKTTNRTTGYNPDGGVQEFFDWNVTAPAGLIKSNAVDMVTYLKAVLGVTNSFADASVLSENHFYSKNGIKIGLGLSIIQDGENEFFFKTGDLLGQSSIISYDRKNNWGLIILINQRDSNLIKSLFSETYEIIKK